MRPVSVVIPTYKASPFIRETLASVFAQTRLPDEVVVADDCSPDDTVAVVEEIAKTAPVPVRVIRLEKNSGGPARPLNVGIEAARGDLIATLDHDDTFPPNKLADQVPFLSNYSEVGLVFGGVQCVGSDPDWNSGVSEWIETSIASLPKSAVSDGGYLISSISGLEGVVRRKCFAATCSNMLFPRRVWRECGGFDTGTTVSSDMAFLAAVAGCRDLGYVSSPGAVWKLHRDSYYKTASDYARVHDQLRTYARLRTDLLSAAALAEYRQVVRQLAFDGAYRLRKGGDHRRAMDCLVRGVRVTGVWPRAASEFIKVLASGVADMVGGLRS